MGRKKNLTGRVRIIKAAYQLFLEHGYENVTTKQIAEQLGMAHSLLHYYYPTKQDLLTDIVNTFTAKLQSYFIAQRVELTDKPYVYGLATRLFYESLAINPKLIHIYQAALNDGVVLRRITKYKLEKLAIPTTGISEKTKLAPYMLSGSMAQALSLYTDGETEFDLREVINLSLESYYTTTGVTKAWIHATIGLIDRRLTGAFIREFLAEMGEMMGTDPDLEQKNVS